ncbi:hypothetical protein RM545_03375 [Zunongwangia sp. F260]|uniref:Uncharacterized protein n=1 Tax=Autumnicola lenta TaxID=3075593 RepID=A0ABU3CHA4_9FLAO|nr:hypothetical protein [Zunongwangia sp. F260]MDT0645720.1 hypothetical protein [Zunongwangia sp. F260]
MKSGIFKDQKVEKVKHYIRSTCQRCTDRSTENINFHKAIVAHYFEARNVEIFYDKSRIEAEIFVGRGYVPITFDCLDLPVMLCSCIKEDQQSMEIYQTYVKDLSTTMALSEGQLQE